MGNGCVAVVIFLLYREKSSIVSSQNEDTSLRPVHFLLHSLAFTIPDNETTLPPTSD